MQLIPLIFAICVLTYIINNEQKSNRIAFDRIAQEKQTFFNKLYDLAPLFQTEDSLFQSIASGNAPITALNEYAFIPYVEIVSDILDAPFTFSTLNVDSITVVTKYPHLSDTELQHSKAVEYYEEGVGFVKLFLYKTGEDRYWVLGITDGDLIRTQTRSFINLIVLLLIATVVLNFIQLYQIGKNINTKKK